MKKTISLLLVLCLVMSTLTGCEVINELEQMNKDSDQLTQEIIDLYKEAFLIAFYGLFGDMHKEIMQTWSETFSIAGNGIAQLSNRLLTPMNTKICDWFTLNFNSYEDNMKHKWEPIFTSYYDGEELTIARRHGTGFVGVHCTYYMVTIKEDGKCTYYYPPAFAPCKELDMMVSCSGNIATLEEFCEQSGMITTIYPYVEAICAYQTVFDLNKISKNKSDYETVLDAFTGVIQTHNKEVMSETASGAIDIILSGNDLLSKVNEVAGYATDAYDIYETTQIPFDLRAAENIPATQKMVETYPELWGILFAANGLANSGLDPDNLGSETKDNSINWQNLKALEKLSPDGRNVEFQVTETHVQWRCEGDEQWQDLKALEKLSPDGRQVVFLVTDTHIKWRFLNDSELLTIQAQKQLHETFKSMAYHLK